MSNFSATIPVALVDAANAHLDEPENGRNFGPSNFSVPASADGQYATHAGLHCWHVPAFRQALQDMVDGGAFPGLAITDGAGEPNFVEHCQGTALEWVQQRDTWHLNPIMTGDQRAFGGKTWESLIDYNVWQPPVGWREVVASGYPAWVQPTGAHDAYNLGDRVIFNGTNYESLINANVWSPTDYPAGWKVVA